MDIHDFDYHLPPDRIAQFPSLKRDEARLMVLSRDTGEICHSRFGDLSRWFEPSDLLVVNDTQVIPARLRGRKASGGRVEIFLTEPLSPDGEPVPPLESSGAFGLLTWGCRIRCSGRPFEGMEVILDGGDRGFVHHRGEGGWHIKFSGGEDLRAILERCGEVPLPPYIRRSPVPSDRHRYQTMYARKEGSIAAPTAGLHFSEELIAAIERKGVHRACITLQVGEGTFLPVKTSSVEDHPIHREYVEVEEPCCRRWSETRSRGGRVFAVGTTTVRALESAVRQGEGVAPFRGFTSLFIRPGYRFQAVDALITNFHLPRSTLLMLVMAFAGMEQTRRAYAEAIEYGYRFYSYGDAMLIQ
jgi:S-adenosylmethionine:tRNA ribosyltransferase-isomerase